MKKTNYLVGFALLGVVLLGTGCMDRPPAPVCPAPTELSQTESLIINFQGLDMLLVVDNSQSMKEEQQIFATAIYNLVNTLTNNPDPAWKFPDAEDVRIGVITTDVGLVYGPESIVPSLEQDFGCDGAGDEGKLQTPQAQTPAVDSIDLNGVIPCAVPDGGAAYESSQCPLSTDTDTSVRWVCEDRDSDGSPSCFPPTPGNTSVECQSGTIWAATPTGDTDTDGLPIPNYNLPLEVACSTKLGIKGCGIEQQLQASKLSLDRYGAGQGAFVRDEALLAIIILSDEEDCSIATNEFFDTPEFSDLTLNKLNVACQIHDNLLFAPDQYRNWWVEQKGGVEAAVVFAAIVGVPPGNVCEGFGTELGRCLDEDAMAFVEVEDPDPQSELIVARYACTRTEEVADPDDTDSAPAMVEVEVTGASPGRRYVELAEDMGSAGYIYSICNADWSPAVENIAELIAKNLSSSCYPKPLEWDPGLQEATCDVVIVNTIDRALGEDEDYNALCGFDLEGVEPVTEIGEGDEAQSVVFCPLPKLKAPLDCDNVDDDALAAEFGWYYCEDLGEDFDEACQDALDNDNDGAYDCDDDSCVNCPVCGGKECDSISCRYAVRLTKKTRDDVNVKNRPMAVQCLQTFTFTDTNCQENTAAVCWDDIDNDGNGTRDCDGAPEEDQQEEPWRFAEAACCPITQTIVTENPDGTPKEIRCVLTDDDDVPVFENTCNSDSRPDDAPAYNTTDRLPPACRAAAAALGCQVPPQAE